MTGVCHLHSAAKEKMGFPNCCSFNTPEVYFIIFLLSKSGMLKDIFFLKISMVKPFKVLKLVLDVIKTLRRLEIYIFETTVFVVKTEKGDCFSSS